MKTIVRMLILSVLVAALLCSALSAAAATEFKPTPKAADDGANGWWVGTNVTCTPTGGTGFTLTSKDGGATGANVVWGVTYGQIKQTPYLHLTIDNDEAADASLYTKIFMTSGADQVALPPYVSEVANWVRASSVKGANVVDVKAAVDGALSGLADDALLMFQFYVDTNSGGAGATDTLIVSSLYLSSEQGNAEQQEDPKQEEPTPTGRTAAIPAAVAAVSVCAALLLVSKKRA